MGEAVLARLERATGLCSVQSVKTLAGSAGV